MKRIWLSGLLLSLLFMGCAKGKPVPWTSVASSWDGSKLVAVGDGYIHTSTDFGASWTKTGPWGYWTSVASSWDGSKLVAVKNSNGTSDKSHGYIFLSTDSGVSWTQANIDWANWVSVASSSDGSKLVVSGNDYQGHPSVYTSVNSGVSWTRRSPIQQSSPESFSGAWLSVASSADGSKLVAVANDGPIYTSVNSGVSWTEYWVGNSSKNWTSVASSADGSKLVAVVGGGSIYTSANSGLTWTQEGMSNNWASVASSADGTKLIAVAGGEFIYTSTDSGTTWTQTGVSDNWVSVASSADGNKLVALTSSGSIYTSTNSGVTWTKLGGGGGGGRRDAGVPDAPGAKPDVQLGDRGGGAGGIGGVGGSGGMGGSVSGDAAKPDALDAQPDVPRGGTGGATSSVGGATGSGGAGDSGVPDATGAQPDALLGGSGAAGGGGATRTGGFNPFGGGGSGKGGVGGSAGGTLASGGTGASGGAGGYAGSTSAPPSLTVWVAQKTTGSTGQITLSLRIDNKTAQSVNMSTVTLRYWYQDEGLGTALAFASIYVGIGYSNLGTVAGKAVAASPAVPGADHYLELSFTGTLAAQGDTLSNDQFNVRVSAHTLSYAGVVDVTNDYSYDGGAAALYEPKITLHDMSGKVIWGVVPGTSGPADAAVDTSVSGDAGVRDAPAAPDAEPDVPIGGTGGVPATGGTMTTGGATASGGSGDAGMPDAPDGQPDVPSGGTNDGAATDGGTPPSCSGLAVTCGPSGNEDCCTSLLVPGGTFYRSYDGVDLADMNYPATVADFYLDKYEITVGRFRKFVNAGMGTQANPPATGAGAHPLIAGSGWDSTWNVYLPADTAALKTALKTAQGCPGPDHTWTDTAGVNESRPQNCLNWHTAFAFCAWDGGRLPTEAESNYAAAGGGEQRYYPWSSPATSTTVDDSYAVYCGGSCSILNVGSKSPKGDGKWGHADLAGNLWEWTLDWYSTYQLPCSNCADLVAASTHVIRGGSFIDVASTLRSADRNPGRGPGDIYTGNYGSRCARSSL